MTTTKNIPITRMDCPTCISVLEREVTRLEGVEEVPGKYLHSSRNVAVLFTSPTCPTCKVFKPEFEELAERHGGADFYEMDIVSTERWRDYDVLSIPTVLVFKAGEVSDRFTALPRTEEIASAITA